MRRKGFRRHPASAGARLAIFLLWSGAVALAWLLRRPFLPRRRWTAAAARFTAAWSRGVLRLLEIEVRVQGLPPRPPFFLVGNHLGYLDIPVLAATVPCTFVAKAEVAGWPLFGLLASLSGTVFVNRRSGRDAAGVNERIAAVYRNGGGVALFPEGTSTEGDAVARFRTPLLDFPAAAGIPVHVAVLRYRAPLGLPPASESMCWWGEMTFLPHFLNLFRMAGMQADLVFVPATFTDPDRKRLAEALQRAAEEYLGGLDPRSTRPREAMA